MDNKNDGFSSEEIRKSVEQKTQKSVVVPESLTGKSRFRFRCYPGIACFTKCCSGIKIYLSPYDILRLKKRLGMTSTEFLLAHTLPVTIDRTPLPTVILKMKDDESRSCPFVTPEGCTVYSDRPMTCRYYPIGMGIMKKFDTKTGEEFFIKIKEDHCLGHNEDKEWTIEEWTVDQEADLYEKVNHDWMEVVLKAETLGMSVDFSIRSLELFNMVSTNLDKFRDFVFNSRFLTAYEISPDVVERMKNDDLELLRFSLRWLRFTMFGEGDFKFTDEAVKEASAKKRATALEQMKKLQEKGLPIPEHILRQIEGD